MENNTLKQNIDPQQKKMAIEFAIYCSSKEWKLTGWKFGKWTDELWEDFIKEVKDGK